MFVDNIFLKGAYFARTIRSPVKSGRLLSIEVPPLPEDCRLISAADIPGENSLAGAGKDFNPDFSHSILASGELRYKGEPVALLVGPDPAVLAALLPAVTVHYEEHEAPPPRVYAQREITVDTGGLARASKKASKDDARAGEPVRMIESRYQTPEAVHNPSECTGAVALFEGGRCIVHTATQWPRHVLKTISRVLAVPEADISLGCEDIGIHYDAKLWYPSLIAAQAALAAHITGKPVKFMLSRSEEAGYAPRRASASMVISTEIDRMGNVVKTGIDIETDLGAAGFFADEIIDRMSLAAISIYRLGEVHIRAKALGSARPPAGAFAGFGLSQGFFAIESHIARLAAELRISPLDWRLQNAAGKHDRIPIGTALKKPVPLPALLDMVSAQSGFGRKWAAYELLRQKAEETGEPVSPVRGIGIAFAWQGAGLLYHTGDNPLPPVTAALKNSALTVRCAHIKEGAAKFALWQEIVHDSVSFAIDTASFEQRGGDWGDDPTTLSQDLTFIPSLIETAAKNAALQGAAGQNAAPADALPPDDPDGQVTTVRYESAEVPGWAGKSCDEKAFSYPAFCAAVVEVEIDAVEWKPLIRGIWLCVEAGRILSLQEVSNTLAVSGIAALAWAQGKHEAPNILDMPHIDIDFIPSDCGQLTGIDELPFSSIPAAFAAAVSQAAGVRFDQLPVHPSDIWEAIRPREQTGEETRGKLEGGKNY